MAGYRINKTRTILESGEEVVFYGQEGLKIPTDAVKLTTGQVSELTGVKRSTLRHYDDIGLLCPGRTGEGISNNRKLYSPYDLDRLQIIQTLTAYHFSLDKIKQFLDGDNQDIYELMAEKLWELICQEGQLRTLIRFVHFVELTEMDDLIEGLANGPVQLDNFADLARGCSYYEESLQKLDDMSDEEATEILSGINGIIKSIYWLDNESGFCGVAVAIDHFFEWWDEHIISYNEIGYLGFWAIFEDHSFAAEYIEENGKPGDASTIQMYAFFVMIYRLMIELDPFIEEVSHLADKDIVASIDKSEMIIALCMVYLFGPTPPPDGSGEMFADLTFWTLVFIERILDDEDLVGYLEIADEISYGIEEVQRVRRIIDIMGSDEETNDD